MHRNEQIEADTRQRQAARLVDREVQCCMSSLVSTLAKGAHFNMVAADLSELAEKAFELAAPVLDYESAAREAGFTLRTFGAVERVYRSNKDGSYPTSSARCWHNACEDHDIDAHELEVYEHWAVSTWLADKLEAKGERVDRAFAGMTVWARTTTGQAISMDAVILCIVAETGYASGGEG